MLEYQKDKNLLTGGHNSEREIEDRIENWEETHLIEAHSRHKPKREGWGECEWEDRFLDKGMKLYKDLVCSSSVKRNSFLLSHNNLLERYLGSATRETSDN